MTHALYKAGVECLRLSLQQADMHLDPGLPEALQPSACNQGVGVLHCHHHPADPGLNQGIGTGGGAAMVATGFQCDIGRGPLGAITRRRERNRFGMGFPRALVKPSPTTAPF